jgi:cytochrome P450
LGEGHLCRHQDCQQVPQLQDVEQYDQLSDRESWMKSDAAQQKKLEYWNYSKERVDRRLASTPDRPDLWTKILEKGAPDDPTGLSMGEHYSLASLFMIAGTETTATALSGTTTTL